MAAEVRAAPSKIPIIHLHGTLGYLPWQDKPPEDTREFHNVRTPHDIQVGAKNIKIIHEDTAERDNDFQRARALLGEAERILFMGFGYNTTNMERLDIRSLNKGVAIGTCVGLSGRERNKVTEYSEGRLTLHD